MKLKLALATVLAAAAPLAGANPQNPQPSFRDFEPVESQPATAGTVIVHQFPQPSFNDAAPIERAATQIQPQPATEVLVQQLPQPSFQG